ncbi:MAG: DUF3789 domain-containing protein [Lachnospiraceae bacterium]|nr:DUF3789 domain-containing protein [Lachnospiraceae bacterium]
MLTHFIAFCAGGGVGVMTACMCIAAGEADRKNGESNPCREVSHPLDGTIHANKKNYDEKGDGKE